MNVINGRARLALSACVLALALGGCGGGGGGGGVAPITPAPTPAPAPTPPPPPPPPAPTPPPPPATNFNDSEYQRSSGANSAGAITAYNDGATGQGVKIGLVDTGVNPALPDFAGKIDPASGDVAGGNRGVADQSGHGTATAATAAAARNGSGILGVAFGATIVSENSSDPTSCTSDKCDSSDGAIARGIDTARIAGVRVINISLGSDTGSPLVNAAIARAAAAGIVVVMSAGNSGADPTGDNPEGFAASAAAANANVIIAGAVDTTRTIASFSNRAGTSANSYLTALGDRVVAPDNTGTLFFWSGTSFSAPIISGAVALLASAFPNLTGQQIIAILFQSADDAGAPGVDAVYGHGILDIPRAFQPIGTTSLPGSKTAVDPMAGGGTSSTPMGDAHPMLGGVIILDGFSRAFVMNLTQAVRQAPLDQPLTAALQPGLQTSTVERGPAAVSLTIQRNPFGAPEVGLAQLGLSYQDARQAKVLSGLALSRVGHNTAVALGISESGRTLEQRLAGSADHAFLIARDPLSRMGFYSNGAASFGVRQKLGKFGLTVTSERGTVFRPGEDPRIAEPGYTIGAATFDRRFGRATFSLGASRLDEKRTMLGAQFTDLIGGGGATSWFADAGGRLDLGRGWQAEASYRRGWTSADGIGALGRGGRLATDAWSFDVARDNFLRAGDSFAIRVMQPLRVRSGGFALSVPVSYDYATLTAGYAPAFFNLAPTGREIDVEAAYGVPLWRGNVSANLYARRDPGNIATLAPDVGAALRYSLGF